MNLENLQLTELSVNEAREIDGGCCSSAYYLLMILLFGKCYNPCPKKKH